MKQCVFIIGGSRTGSELLKGILEKYSEITFVNEMHLLAPRWLRKDFQAIVKSEYGGFGEKLDTEKILKLIKKGKLEGYYWEDFFNNVDQKVFKKLFDQSEKGLKDVLDTAMAEKALSEKKKIKGAKFPLHYSYTNKLVDWFPEASLIHTVRDPRGVYYSQSRKYIANDDGKGTVCKKKILQFIHISIQSLLTVFLHIKYRNDKNYFFSRYEDLIENPHFFFKSLCEFLSISFNQEMVTPKVHSNSSFTAHRGKKKELEASAIKRWKENLPVLERLFITVFTLPAIIIFGYSL